MTVLCRETDVSAMSTLKEINTFGSLNLDTFSTDVRSCFITDSKTSIRQCKNIIIPFKVCISDLSSQIVVY